MSGEPSPSFHVRNRAGFAWWSVHVGCETCDRLADEAIALARSTGSKRATMTDGEHSAEAFR